MIDFRGNATGELNIKRCYLDGIEIKTTCPKCRHVTDWDQMDGDSYNYPKMGVWEDYRVFCFKCKHEWKERIKLNVSIVSTDSKPPLHQQRPRFK